MKWPPKKRPTLKVLPGPRSALPKRVRVPLSAAVEKEPIPYNQVAVVSPEETAKATAPAPKSVKHRNIYFRKIHLSKKQWAMVVAGLLVLLGGGSYGALASYKHHSYVAPQKPQPKVATRPLPPPKPKTEVSRLSGVEVDPALNNRPVTGIMIENSPDSRPQSGLKDAGIVFEAVAEGGITRFLALYQAEQPDYIGPVRSVRPYYLDFLMPFDAGIAHVGGAPQALQDIKSFGLKDLDQFFNSQAYWRITERFAPHNVYTSFERLDALNTSKGYTSSTFVSLPRKKEVVSKNPPTARLINLNISGPLYNVHYDYDATKNVYLRSEAGSPHNDARSGSQLAPKVVVALVMGRGIASDGQHTEYQDTGSGHMYVFQDGMITEGTWKKSDRKAQFAFTDSAGNLLPLNPGQTWFTIVDNNASVTYTP